MHRILFIWKSSYPWDVRVEKICKALGRSGSEVWLLARWADGQPEYEEAGDFKIVRVGKGFSDYAMIPVSVNPVWRKLIKDKMTEIKPDLVIPREIMLAEAVADMARRSGVPVVIDMAEHYPAAMKVWKKYEKTFLKRLFVHHLDIPELVEKRSVSKADGIITVCQEQNDRLHIEFGFPHEKMQTVHNTPEIDWYDSVRKGSSARPVVFGHHGYMTSEKNLDVFLKGFILAAGSNSEIRLILAGKGDNTAELERIASNSAARDRIQFTGQYNRYQLNDILSQVDIGVVPYQANNFNNHTIHNKVFDFMATAKPMIVSDARPLKRLICETKSGLSVDCSDPEIISRSILEFLGQDLQSYSINGLKAFTEKYNWQEDSRNLVEFLNKFI